MTGGRVRRSIAAFAFLFLVLASFIPVSGASSQASLYDIAKSFHKALKYIDNITKYVDMFDGIYAFISEYPDIPIWGKLNNITFVPGYANPIRCGGALIYPEVQVFIDNEEYNENYSVWSYHYTFWSRIVVPGLYENRTKVLKLSVTEIQSSTNISVYLSNIEYYNISYSCMYIDGGKIDIYVGDRYVGKASSLSNDYVSIRPMGSFRFSLRHVQVLASVLFNGMGERNQYLDDALSDEMYAVFGDSVPYRDLYANGLIAAGVFVPYDWSAIFPDNGDGGPFYFYDAHWFGNKTGYARLEEWAHPLSAGDYGYPVYPYKSKVVSASEIIQGEGGNLFIIAMEHPVICGSNAEVDPLLLAWRGLYYYLAGNISGAVGMWEEIVSKWDGNGVKVCYSDNYNTVRLAAAIELGTLLAGSGAISWDTVDEMVNVLLRTQWQGSGWYRPGGNSEWVKIYKIDHRGGFLVAYNVAPDGSFGSTGFRPHWTDYLAEAKDMEPEYPGVIPTNAETTLVAMTALWLYAKERYDVVLTRHSSLVTGYSYGGSGSYYVVPGVDGGSIDLSVWNSESEGYVEYYVVNSESSELSVLFSVSGSGSFDSDKRGEVTVSIEVYNGGVLFYSVSYGRSFTSSISWTKHVLVPLPDSGDITVKIAATLKIVSPPPPGPGPGPTPTGTFDVASSSEVEVNYTLGWP